MITDLSRDILNTLRKVLVRKIAGISERPKNCAQLSKFDQMLALVRGRSRLLERGAELRRSVIIVDVGLAGIFTLIVCKAHRHA